MGQRNTRICHFLTILGLKNPLASTGIALISGGFISLASLACSLLFNVGEGSERCPQDKNKQAGTIMAHIQSWEREPKVEAFEEITEEEIISLWNCFQAGGLSGNEAWYAILTGIALDMAFEKGRNRTRIDQ